MKSSHKSPKPSRKIASAVIFAFVATVPASALAQTAAPTKEIVLGESIAGVSLGDTPDQIRQKVGPETFGGKDLDGRVNEIMYGAELYGVSLMNVSAAFYPKLEGNPAYGVFTGNPKVKTPEGIHVNSTVEELKAAYGDKLKMEVVANGLEVYSLFKESDAPIGDRNTNFMVLNGKVQGISIDSVEYFWQAVK